MLSEGRLEELFGVIAGCGVDLHSLKEATMEFMRRFCKFYGGGLYAAAGGLCTAELDGDTCLIKELIADTPECCDAIAASVGASLGAKTCTCYLPAAEGDAYIAAPPGTVPADCVWNLAFD